MKGIEWLETLHTESAFFKENKVPSLESFSQILQSLGNPDLKFENRVIIGGTAGKGTTCRYIEQGLLLAGRNTTLLSSPHLQIVEERIRINGKLCSLALLNTSLLKIKKCTESLELKVTYYESIILAGLLIGSKEGGVLIGEIGLGGEWDALNAVKGNRVAGLTFIGPDHLEILGPNLEDVAKTKAGIFNEYCVQGFSYDKKYCSIINEISKCDIIYIKGINKKLNKKLARKICEQILCSKSFEIPKLALPGRWEKLDEKIIIEGAHSLPRFEFILPKIKKIQGKKVAIISMMKNHDFKDLEIIISEFDEVIWTTIPKNNYWPPTELLDHFKKGKIIEDPEEALAVCLKTEAKTLVLGSFYLCGRIRSHFYSEKAMRTQFSEFPKT